MFAGFLMTLYTWAVLHKLLNNSTLPETTMILHFSLSSEKLLKKFITSIPVIFGKSKSKSKTSGFISKYFSRVLFPSKVQETTLIS